MLRRFSLYEYLVNGSQSWLVMEYGGVQLGLEANGMHNGHVVSCLFGIASFDCLPSQPYPACFASYES